MAQIRSLTFESAEETVTKLRPYISALIHADPSVLKSFEAEILDLDALTDEERDAVTEQIWFPTRPTEELWDDLESFCAEHDGSDLFPDKQEVDFADRLVAGLTSHGDAVAAEALSRLSSGDNEGNWLEVFLVRLLGRLRLEAATPVMTALVIDPDDHLLEERDLALARIGSEAVMRWLAQVGASRDWNERMGVAWNLQNIHFYLKTAIGRILKENGYTTSWLSKDHNVPAFVASQIG